MNENIKQWLIGSWAKLENDDRNYKIIDVDEDFLILDQEEGQFRLHISAIDSITTHE